MVYISVDWKAHKDNNSKLRQKKGGDTTEREAFVKTYGKTKGAELFEQYGEGRFRSRLAKKDYERHMDEHSMIDKRLKNYSDRADNR